MLLPNMVEYDRGSGAGGLYSILFALQTAYFGRRRPLWNLYLLLWKPFCDQISSLTWEDSDDDQEHCPPSYREDTKGAQTIEVRIQIVSLMFYVGPISRSDCARL